MQQTYSYYLLDVFTEGLSGGNPLAVVIDSDDINENQRQKIASELNLSETVFLSNKESQKNFYKLDIYTPSHKSRCAGHPIIGSASLLAFLDENSKKRINEVTFAVAGLEITAKMKLVEDGCVWTSCDWPFKTEQINKRIDIKKLTETLTLQESDILTDRDSPLIINNCFNHLFVPIRNKDAIKRCYPNLELWDKMVTELDVDVVYAFTYLTVLPTSHIHARCFYPHRGILEDPATGSAANALAGYICAGTKNLKKKVSKTIEQGFEMGRKSIIQLDFEVNSGNPVNMQIGGNTRLVNKGELPLP